MMGEIIGGYMRVYERITSTIWSVISSRSCSTNPRQSNVVHSALYLAVVTRQRSEGGGGQGGCVWGGGEALYLAVVTRQ